MTDVTSMKYVREKNKKAHVLGLMLFGVGCGLAGAMLYNSYQHVANRAKQNLLYRNNPAAAYSFADPYGLSIDQRLSAEGTIETYVLHESSRKEYLLAKDMMPETHQFLTQLRKRVYHMDKPESKQTLDELTQITDIIKGL